MSFPSADAELPAALYWAARWEARGKATLARVLRARGWTPCVLPYTAYGTAGTVRVLARVVLAPPETGHAEVAGARGWRRFMTATVADVPVTVTLGSHRHRVRSQRDGYIDTVLTADLPPGWGSGTLSAEGASADEGTVKTAVRVVGGERGLGLVSDIDDTVIITALPRPLVAFWNTFVRSETSRRPVPGMADLYRRVVREHPDAFVVYLSTGAWNVAAAHRLFLRRFGFPDGPLLLTDWGPTSQSMFRSGARHKRDQLQRLLADFPQLEWVFVGDDGQLDPVLYDEAAAGAESGRVRAIGIRQLSPGQQVLTHGSPGPVPAAADAGPSTTSEVRAPDGFGLLRLFEELGVLGTATAPLSPPE